MGDVNEIVHLPAVLFRRNLSLMLSTIALYFCVAVYLIIYNRSNHTHVLRALMRLLWDDDKSTHCCSCTGFHTKCVMGI